MTLTSMKSFVIMHIKFVLLSFLEKVTVSVRFQYTIILVIMLTFAQKFSKSLSI